MNRGYEIVEHVVDGDEIASLAIGLAKSRTTERALVRGTC